MWSFDEIRALCLLLNSSVTHTYMSTSCQIILEARELPCTLQKFTRLQWYWKSLLTPIYCFQFVLKNSPQSFCMSPVIGSTVRSTSTIVHCSRDGRLISDLMFIFLRLEPEQATNGPGFPASHDASEHWALVIESGETSKFAIRFVIALCKKMKAQKLCMQNQTRKIC